MTVETALLLTAAGCCVFAVAFGMGYYKALHDHLHAVLSMRSIIVGQRDAIKRVADLPERSRQGRTIARQALTTWALKGETT